MVSGSETVPKGPLLKGNLLVEHQREVWALCVSRVGWC